MKKGFYLFLALFYLALPMNAHETLGKLDGPKILVKVFTESLKNGRNPHGLYRAVNKENKELTTDEIKDFCKKNDIILANSKRRNFHRFGDEVGTLDYADFMPAKEYPFYLMTYIGDYQNLKYSDMKTVSARYYLSGLKGLDGIVHTASVLWSGGESNGWADGKGAAVVHIPEIESYLVMEGEFKNGIPSGTVKYRLYKPKKQFSFDETKVVTFDAYVSPTSGEGLRSFRQPHTSDKHYAFVTVIEEPKDWGFLNEDGSKVVINPQFYGVSSEFKDGKAVVSNKEYEFYTDKSGNELARTEAQLKKDYDNDLAFVKRMSELTLPKSYMREHNFLYSAVFDEDYYMDHSDYNNCNKAFTLMEKYNNAEFNQYWDKVYDKYQQVIALFNSEVEESNRLNRAARDRAQVAENARIAEKEAQKAKEAAIAAIGVKESKWPKEKGNSDILSDITGTYDLNGGEITLTNGKSFSWYIVCDSDGDYKYFRYWNKGSKSPSFSSYEQMVEDMKRQ